MDFAGLEPWREHVAQIECVVGDRTYDLHNFADFRGFEWSPDARLTLYFDTHDEWHPLDARVSLVFTEVRDLMARQAADFAPESSRDLDEWAYVGLEDGRGRVRFDLPDLSLDFTAASATLVTGAF